MEQNKNLIFRMPGSCGELVQGLVNGIEVLISYPINLYSYLTISQTEGILWNQLPMKMQQGMKVLLNQLQMEEDILHLLRFKHQSEIPVGVGMASSTADLTLACAGLAHYLGYPITSTELAKLLVQIEPTDSIFFPEITLFDQNQGQLYQKIGTYPEMGVLVLGLEATIDTIEFKQKRLWVPDVSQAYKMVGAGLQKNDLSLMGLGAMLSAVHWQEILPKPRLNEIIDIALAFGCYGIQIAHSGTILGIMYDPMQVYWWDLQLELAKAGIFKCYPYLWNLQTVPGGVEVWEDGCFNKMHKYG